MAGHWGDLTAVRMVAHSDDTMAVKKAVRWVGHLGESMAVRWALMTAGQTEH